MRLLLAMVLLVLCSGCTTVYPNQQITGQDFPSVSGQTLEQQAMRFPEDVLGQQTLLLVGYKQDSQFDIDRWLIGLDMTQTQVAAYELPTIAGLLPRMFQTTIDNGMRAGIPKPLWKGVVTIYQDGESVQAFTGNQAPNNARVILLNAQGQISYFYDQGFSVAALNNLRQQLSQSLASANNP
ncbi:hypothetical protein FLM48_19040 [Shewanella sp. Scap07]|uniref:hypothetical protein n=1 Tax=Shewanella sp. Scap07 TaxID=2589987 RepID=UPI0015C08D3A|nr:hypothetical protein [Shewanella sp. Scap07]QLE86981.1 hypothetical protein FLM48_19040 [Shewanella sp. Scap07]